MNKKIAFIAFTVLAIFAFTVWAVTTNGPAAQHTQDNQVKMEQVSTGGADPAHCDPSSCTPEEKAKCPYGSGAKATAATSAKDAANCPATSECPPSKCQGGNKAEASTATL